MHWLNHWLNKDGYNLELGENCISYSNACHILQENIFLCNNEIYMKHVNEKYTYTTFDLIGHVWKQLTTINLKSTFN